MCDVPDRRRAAGEEINGPNDPAPRFGPCEKLDIELELGAIVGQPSHMGSPVTTEGCSRSVPEDGDTVTNRGWCESSGGRIGFGTVTARILPAAELPQAWA